MAWHIQGIVENLRKRLFKKVWAGLKETSGSQACRGKGSKW